MIAMPEAFHSATDDLPFADDWANTPGVRLKLLMADIEGARFAVRIRFAPFARKGSSCRRRSRSAARCVTEPFDAACPSA
jgi:hypothetical protein